MKMKIFFLLFKEFKMMHKYHQQFQVMRINLMISWFFFSVLTLLHFGFYKAPENEDYSCVFATVKFTRQNRRKTHFRCKTLQILT